MREIAMNQVGKRFRCATCTSEVLVTKSGEGELHCCGAPMEQLQPKQTASAD
jgi:desulfoferrodoxin-like iron-binding protein